MTKNDKILEKAVGRALSGEGAHAEGQHVFEGFDWRLAGKRPEGVPHSLFQLLNHLNYWQNWVVEWLEGKKPPLPKHASGSWPGSESPESRKEWDSAVENFSKGLAALDKASRSADLFTDGGRKSRLEMLQTIASHNSYHVGQAVLLRQMLESWPPPSGGLTW
ncbi:MAG TPA: DinB family protein [Methylomirabilota bacterium]|nr:DinB family protein [Methylomirabilota bacterium]